MAEERDLNGLPREKLAEVWIPFVTRTYSMR